MQGSPGEERKSGETWTAEPHWRSGTEGLEGVMGERRGTRVPLRAWVGKGQPLILRLLVTVKAPGTELARMKATSASALRST